MAKRIVDVTGDADVAHRTGAATIKTPKREMISVSVMFSLSGVNKKQFLDKVKANAPTYADWNCVEWSVETDGKEDRMFSPFLRKPFEQAQTAGLIPGNLHTITGTWGAMHDTGELTYLNLVHMPGCDGTDPDDLTRFEMEGRDQAMMAVAAMRGFNPGCETAKLRNFGMTLGIRDTRKIDAQYNMTKRDVRG